MEFNNLNELKERLLPAFYKKIDDLKFLGFNKTVSDIWNDLSLNKWKDFSSLSLDIMVDDILKYMPKMEGDNYEK